MSETKLKRAARHTPPATPAPHAGPVAVTLKKPHTHRGVDYAPETTIEVEPHQAALLERWGVI